MEDKKYINELVNKVFSNSASIVLTLLSIVASEQLNMFKDRPWDIKILVLIAIFVAVLLVLALGYAFVDAFKWFKSIIHLQNRGIIFPHNISPSDILPFIFENIDIKYTYIFNNETGYFDLEQRNEYILKGTGTGTPYINHIYKISDKDLQEGNVQVRIESLSKGNRIIKSEFIEDDDFHSEKLINRVYRVTFEKKVESGQSITYALCSYRKNYKLPYETNSSTHDCQEKIAVIETAKFNLSVEFPRNYKLIQPQILVFGKSDIELPKVEKIYRKLNKSFEMETSSNPPRASLLVDAPIPNIRYQIMWRLPSKELLDSEGFYTNNNPNIQNHV